MSRLVRCIRCEEWYYESAPSTLCHECHHKQSIMDAVEKLSPSTRDLLLRSPEAVEACVKAVKANRVFRYHEARCAEYRCRDCDDLRAAQHKAMDTAIALLPKREETPQ